MRILVEPSDYTFYNVGDIAMLQAAVTRLSALWPEACIQVLTDDPDSLAIYCPSVKPLVTRGRKAWFAEGYLFGPFSRHLPRRVTEQLLEMERNLRRRPLLAESIMRSRLKLTGRDSLDLSGFLKAVSQADLLVVSGMGGISDVFEEYAFELLDTLDLAIQFGTPTVMFGQGMGPIQSSKLRARAQGVLPFVDLICLREDRAGLPLLRSLGVALDRILTTGDDAVEIAYQRCSEQLGSGIGVNLRIGWYSEVDQQLIGQVRPILQEVARLHKAPMIPVPISQTPGEEDILTFQQLASGYDNVIDEGEALDNPLKVIEQVQRCRVVVAGSYHAAVFALSQGIPTIGLANSSYYADKFLGLAEQFGPGSEVVFLHDAQMPIKLAAAIERLWRSAEYVRPGLLEAAAEQVELSHAAYRRAYELVASRKVRAWTPKS